MEAALAYADATTFSPAFYPEQQDDEVTSSSRPARVAGAVLRGVIRDGARNSHQGGQAVHVI
jgi:hypothetical protein